MSCSDSLVSDVNKFLVCIFSCCFCVPVPHNIFHSTTYHFHARTARTYVLRTLHRQCCAGISAKAVKLSYTRITKLQYISVAEFERASFMARIFILSSSYCMRDGKTKCSNMKVHQSSFLTGAQDSHLQRVTIPEAAYIQLRSGPHEDEQGNARNM
jgi:hypothetical protein